MADIKTNYVWLFDLIENTMTKDVREDLDMATGRADCTILI